MVVWDRACSDWLAMGIDIYNDILNIHGGIRYFRHYHELSFFMLMPMAAYSACQ